jgi:hypothetical protein
MWWSLVPAHSDLFDPSWAVRAAAREPTLCHESIAELVVQMVVFSISFVRSFFIFFILGA